MGACGLAVPPDGGDISALIGAASVALRARDAAQGGVYQPDAEWRGFPLSL